MFSVVFKTSQATLGIARRLCANAQRTACYPRNRGMWRKEGPEPHADRAGHLAQAEALEHGESWTTEEASRMPMKIDPRARLVTILKRRPWIDLALSEMTCPNEEAAPRAAETQAHVISVR